MKNKRQKKSRFYIYYALLCAVLAFAISCAVGIFYDFIREYEECLPEHVADAYITSLDSEALAGLIRPELEARASGFEKEDALGRELEEAVAGGVIYTECIGEDTPAYDVYCGGRLMKVKLAKISGGRYGFDRYAVASAEIYPEWINDRFTSVTAIVPDGSFLTLNGITVSDEYKTGAEYKSDAVSVFEQASSPLVTYEINDIFGGAEIAAQYRGEQLSMSRLGGKDTYYSDYDLPARSDYTIRAPLDAKVTVNGTIVSADFITSTEKLNGEDAEFEPDTAPELALYSLTGLLNVPEVSVTLNGQELSPASTDGNNIEYVYPDSYKQSYTIRVPRGMKLYCNGFEVGEDHITGGKFSYSPPRTTPKVNVTEGCDVYRVWLYNEPEFTVSAAGAVMESDGNVYTFYPVPASSDISAIKDLSVTFAELFIKYANDSGSKVENNYKAFAGYILTGSNADEILTATLSSYIYNSPYTVSDRKIDAADFIKYSDDCVSVSVNYSFHKKNFKTESDISDTYEMVWIKKGGEWKLAGFTM